MSLNRTALHLAVTATLGFGAGCGGEGSGGDRAVTGASPAEDRDVGTAPAADQDVGTAPAADQDVGTAPAADQDVATAPAADQDVATAPAAEPNDPGAVFRRFQTGLAEGGADAACGLLADSARRQVEDASIGGSCDDWVEEFSGTFTGEIREGLRRTPVLEATEDGDRATVRYRSPILELPLEAELERENGSWRLSKLSEGSGERPAAGPARTMPRVQPGSVG